MVEELIRVALVQDSCRWGCSKNALFDCLQVNFVEGFSKCDIHVVDKFQTHLPNRFMGSKTFG